MGLVVKKIADQVPRGHRRLADQLSRASTSVVLDIAEGANRISRGNKRQRFSEARCETGEVAALAELLAILGLTDEQECSSFHTLAARVSAMLTRLVQAQQ